jgi:hypothetical protein
MSKLASAQQVENTRGQSHFTHAHRQIKIWNFTDSILKLPLGQAGEQNVVGSQKVNLL